MKFLVDNAVSPLISQCLKNLGYNSIHVRDIGMAAASDPDIFDLAAKENRIIISADTDFGTLLVMRSAEKPSFILFRQNNKLPDHQCQQLEQHLPEFEEELLKGCIIVFDDERIRIRELPIIK